MGLELDYKGNKAFRLLNIYERLNKGELLDKSELADDFSVSLKTVQRDIDDLRAYLAEAHFDEHETAIKYDRIKRGYYLVRFQREWLKNEEVLALCKILLESRAFCKEELKVLKEKLLIQVMPKDRQNIENMIKSEYMNYVPLRHNQKLLAPIWELSRFITETERISFTYIRQDGHAGVYLVDPVSIMFSEYYFYLIAFFANHKRKYPAVFRIDRISNIQGTKVHFDIPYCKKFNDGEFRKRVQFMYSGELRRVTFEYSGQSIEAVLDRLPTAEILHEQNDVYTIRVEVYGNGIDMWLRSQGDFIKVVDDK